MKRVWFFFSVIFPTYILPALLIFSFCLLCPLCLTSCSTVFSDSAGTTSSSASKTAGRESWTFIVYMAADNNLESAAISDLREMEMADSDSKVKILALLDRAEGNDASNGDWTDTRLFEVVRGKSSSGNVICSKRISCENLGISAGEASELDMGNWENLADLLAFAKEKYSSDRYGLIIWGHGNGWRSDSAQTDVLSRAYAADDDSGNNLSLPSLRLALEKGFAGRKIDMIAFDCCFGLTAETLCEIKDSASFACGTASLEPSQGWNYTELLNAFKDSSHSPVDFCQSAGSQFKSQYSGVNYACFSAFDLSKVGEIISSFNDLASNVADSIDCFDSQSEMRTIFLEKVPLYYQNSYPCDAFFDLFSFAEILAGQKSELVSEAESFQKALQSALLFSWSKGDFSKVPLGAFFSIFVGEGVPDSTHPDLYVRGSRAAGQTRFVSACPGYVPSQENRGSLLDKLFYTNFTEE